MAQNQQEKKSENTATPRQGKYNNGRGRSRNSGRRPNHVSRVHARGEQMQITFEPRYQGPGVVAILDDGTMINPATLRFNPEAGTPYLCSVLFKETARGRRGSAMPTFVETLGPKEWLTEDQYRKELIVELTFEKRRDGKVVAFYRGWVVLPEDRVRIEPDVKIRCQLRETGGSVIFAQPLSRVVERPASTSKPTAKATLGDTALGKITVSNPEYVALKRARMVDGVHVATSMDDIVISSESRSVWELLSSPQQKITRRSTSQEVIRAAAARINYTNPGNLLKRFGGADNAPLIIRLEVGHLHEAVRQAAAAAKSILGIAETPAAVTPKPIEQPVATAPKPVSQPTPAPRPATTVKAPRPNAQPVKVKEPDAKKTSNGLDDALSKWQNEQRPTSGEDLEFYLMRGIALSRQASDAASSEALALKEASKSKLATAEAAKSKRLAQLNAKLEKELADLQK